ncbi:nucleolar complex-associated protein 3 [Annulohypoxylon truncatum]|uniref:nucleolar complex-associated protein 3 n=1 Tax=Annulohypoxylon truncatum TaxID=327061 RepID=UPI0020087580|nr:nucleolar complex-associated protein 3 [Annulohypoxylon truncatum]KAI1212486.1 nucleolar complex-associated protein 3 [Annulohypoxylon truncatum]
MASRPTKKRKLTPPQSDDEAHSRKSSSRIQKSFLTNAANWDLEQDYETRARKGKKNEKESTRLPLKLQDGRVQHVSAPAVDFGSLESDEDWLEGGDDESEGEEARVRQPEKPDIPEHQQIREAKEELAKIALLLNETPEENGGAFKALAKIGQSRIPAIQKLTLATQLAVYKDVIPGYRIRPVAEDAPGEKLSKDVRRVRTFENSLISGYQAYVKDLTRHAKAGRHHANEGKGQSVASVAIMCACTLLTSVPHFNFRGDLIKILVGKLSNRHVDDDFNKCLQTLETLFKEDEDGSPAMEAVSLLSKMMKAKEYDVHESVVNLFLHLRLLSEFSHKASKDSIDRSDSAVGPNGKKPKSKREFRTKRERKQIKEQKSLQKDMAQADAIVSYEERERKEGETLKLVFGTYFRILKLRVPHLMGAVLEGLSKYAHLINQDFFGDLLEALKDLIRHSEASEDDDVDGQEDDDTDETASARNPSREALLCTTTAFALLAGQDAHNARADLHLDLSFFTAHLYQTLFPLCLNPDLELGARSLHLPDPDQRPSPHTTPTTTKNKVNLQTTTVLLIRCLTAILLPSWNIRSVPPLRLAAFAKQLSTASLHVPEKSAQAILALLSDVAATHGRKIAALWNTEERKGDGTYNPLSESVEASNPFAATVWEGEILRRHYCPKVREGVKLVERSLGRATER